MTELSPAAQAVLDAMYEVNMDFDGENATLAAAALEAAADEVVPETVTPWNSTLTPLISAKDVRQKLLAIAAELRPTTTQETP